MNDLSRRRQSTHGNAKHLCWCGWLLPLLLMLGLSTQHYSTIRTTTAWTTTTTATTTSRKAATAAVAKRIRRETEMTRTTELYMNKKKSSSSKKKKRSSSSSSSSSSSGGQGFGGSGSSATTRDTTATSAVAAGSASSAVAAARRKTSYSDRFPYTGTIRPGIQSPQKIVTNDKIMKPDYWKTGIPQQHKKPMFPWMIEVKTEKEIAKMRESGKLARHILDLAGRAVKPGITTDEIDQLVHDEIIANGAYPSPLNYHGFPKSCCTSVNEVICHGIPDNRQLERGDIINIDITVYYNGYHGDCSEMYIVGDSTKDISDRTRNLLQTTYDCWIAACQFCEPTKDYKDIGTIIEDMVLARGFTTVRNFCGHGIGSVFHTNPNVLHYKNTEPNGQMAVGHTFTIEPMICDGSPRAVTWPDEWTATTLDGKSSAQFEHTLLITEDGVEALTGKTSDSPIQFWEVESNVHQGIWLGTSQNAKREMNQISKERQHQQQQRRDQDEPELLTTKQTEQGEE